MAAAAQCPSCPTYDLASASPLRHRFSAARIFLPYTAKLELRGRRLPSGAPLLAKVFQRGTFLEERTDLAVVDSDGGVRITLECLALKRKAGRVEDDSINIRPGLRLAQCQFVKFWIARPDESPAQNVAANDGKSNSFD